MKIDQQEVQRAIERIQNAFRNELKDRPGVSDAVRSDADAEFALHVYVTTTPDTAFRALPRLMLYYLQNIKNPQVRDLIVALDVEMLDENGRHDPRYEITTKIKREEFHLLSKEQRLAVAGFLRVMDQNKEVFRKDDSLKFILRFWESPQS